MGDLVPCIDGTAVLLPPHVDEEGKWCILNGGEQHYHVDTRYEQVNKPENVAARGRKVQFLEKERVQDALFVDFGAFMVAWCSEHPNAKLDCGTCPHQKVPVMEVEGGFRCPAHGLKFDPDGSLVVPTHARLGGVTVPATFPMTFHITEDTMLLKSKLDILRDGTKVATIHLNGHWFLKPGDKVVLACP